MKIMKVIAYVLGTVGLVASSASSMGCIVLFVEEPKMPESLL